MRLALCTGSASARARADPHRGEALSLPHLRDSLPPPTDSEESRSHPYRREALPLRPLQSAFPAQESASATSAPETRSCYQHQSALPHSREALAECRPGPTPFPEDGKLRLTPGFAARLGRGGVRGPWISATATTFNFSLWGAGVGDPGLICLCFAGQNLFPAINIVSEQRTS